MPCYDFLLHIEHHLHDDKGLWLLTEYKDIEASLPCELIGISIPLARVYERVDWLIG